MTDGLPEPSEDQAVRTCLLVLGMHRSGTSALTRLINLLGAQLPKRVLGAGEGNPTGHWEPEALVDINERLLAEARSSWDDWRQIDLSGLPPDRQNFYRDDISKALADDFGSADIFVLKEPRIARLAPFYLDLLAGMGVTPRALLIYRHPVAVARSLERRGGSNLSYGTLVWLRHVLDAERDTRGVGRVFLSYEGLMEDWRSNVGRIVASVPAVFAKSVAEIDAEAESFLRSDLQHHRAGGDDWGAVGELKDWLAGALDALKAFEQDPQDRAAQSELDQIRVEFDAVAKRIGPAFFHELQARVIPVQAAYQAEAARHAMTQAALSDARRACEQLAMSTDASRTNAAAMASVDDVLRSRLERRVEEVASLTTSLAQAEATIAQLMASRSWRIMEPLRTLGTTVRRFRRRREIEPQ